MHKPGLRMKHEITRSRGTIVSVTTQRSKSFIRIVLIITFINMKVFGDATMYVSCGGPLTCSGSLLSIEGMSLDTVVNSAVATQHYAGIK